ncbi:hypothetical protein CN285_20720 [Bacillus cereus]|nr:hypothetical protein CN285_20720 [Bacillus cereus]
MKGHSSTGCLTLFIKVNDLQGLFEIVKDRVRVIQPVHETFYGKKEFAIVDNNGFVLTFAE